MEIETSKALVIDSLKMLEIYELQEEEKYLFSLKLQRDKIEEFRSELLNKSARITNLEAELANWQKKKLELEKSTLEVVYLTKELKEKELEISKIKTSLNTQANEYEASILELNQVVLKERQEKALEIEKYKAELLSAEDDLEAVVEALENTKNSLLVFQKKYENEVLLNKELENNVNDQTKI